MSLGKLKSEEKPIEKLSLEKKYEYLEQLRDYIYKDVVLADTKAGFALTIVTVALGAALALNKNVNFFWYIGLFFSVLAVFCSMLTLLPRSYVTHEMIKNPNHWVHLKGNWKKEIVRRYYDGIYVVFENFWQKTSKGTTNSIQLLMKSGNSEQLVNSLSEGMDRAFLAMNLKYLWVGKSLLFGFIAICFIGLSLLNSITDRIELNTNDKPSIESLIQTKNTPNNYKSKDTMKVKEDHELIEKLDTLGKN
ncbi:hypothetical protein GTQ40_12795 [Flavobacteriaceae bacterium R38]|nr:hypothetical protein [Flavobacteriaceae bacterium R38]